jgi:hypothetical protein
MVKKQPLSHPKMLQLWAFSPGLRCKKKSLLLKNANINWKTEVHFEWLVLIRMEIYKLRRLLIPMKNINITCLTANYILDLENYLKIGNNSIHNSSGLKPQIYVFSTWRKEIWKKIIGSIRMECNTASYIKKTL